MRLKKLILLDSLFMKRLSKIDVKIIRKDILEMGLEFIFISYLSNLNIVRDINLCAFRDHRSKFFKLK